jgi:hypothetical protein
MLGEKPRRDPIAGLAEFVDADHLNEPVLHQGVERVEVLLADFPHAAIVAAAGHQIMIARPTENDDFVPSPCNVPAIGDAWSNLIIQRGSEGDTVSLDQRSL